VSITNEGDIETTVHWHGVRLDNRLVLRRGHQQYLCTALVCVGHAQFARYEDCRADLLANTSLPR
jgi:hypothetical protein